MPLDMNEAQRQVEAIARDLEQIQDNLDAMLELCHEPHGKAIDGDSAAQEAADHRMDRETDR
jgi:hypothetical protein